MELYVWLALLVSVAEGIFVVYRFRHDARRDQIRLYAVGAALLTFIVVIGLANVVWGAIKGGGGAGGGEVFPSRDLTLNLTTLAAGAVMIMVTGIVTAGATLAGVRAGMGLSRPGGGAVQPVTLPLTVAGVPLGRLRQALTDRLDAEEIKNLAFDLGLDLDSLPQIGSAGRVRELLEYMHRRGELERVVTWVREHRPDIGI